MRALSLLLLMAIGPALAAAPVEAEPVPAEPPPGLVIRGTAGAMDGDTLRLWPDGGGRTRAIRLWGIDAPERDTPAGRDSRRALDRLLAAGGWQVACVPRGGTTYGRTVAHCESDGRDLGEGLLAEGAADLWSAYALDRGPDDQLALRYVAAAAEGAPRSPPEPSFWDRVGTALLDDWAVVFVSVVAAVGTVWAGIGTHRASVAAAVANETADRVRRQRALGEAGRAIRSAQIWCTDVVAELARGGPPDTARISVVLRKRPAPAELLYPEGRLTLDTEREMEKVRTAAEAVADVMVTALTERVHPSQGELFAALVALIHALASARQALAQERRRLLQD